MERIQKNQKLLLELLKSNFQHYGFTDSSLQVEIQYLLRQMLESGQLRLATHRAVGNGGPFR